MARCQAIVASLLLALASVQVPAVQVPAVQGYCVPDRGPSPVHARSPVTLNVLPRASVLRQPAASPTCDAPRGP